MFAKIFYTIFLIALGVLVLKYRKIIHDWTGNFVWAETYLGRGGTYLILIAIGMFLIFYGAIYPFGGFDLLFGD